MIRDHRAICSSLGVLLAVVVACGGQDPAPTPAQRERALAKSPLPKAPPPAVVSPYEADGRTLLAAEHAVLGVPVPRVSRVLSKQAKIARVLVERVPYEAVERFYQKYLQTGRVERSQRGVHFGAATPKPPGNAEARVELYLQTSARGTVVAIYDESPTHTSAPRGEAAVRQAAGFGRVDFTKRVKGVTE